MIDAVLLLADPLMIVPPRPRLIVPRGEPALALMVPRLVTLIPAALDAIAGPFVVVMLPAITIAEPSSRSMPLLLVRAPVKVRAWPAPRPETLIWPVPEIAWVTVPEVDCT